MAAEVATTAWGGGCGTGGTLRGEGGWVRRWGCWWWRGLPAGGLGGAVLDATTPAGHTTPM